MAFRHMSAIGATLLAMCFSSHAAAAELPPAIAQAQTRVQSALGRFENSKRKLEKTRGDAQVLEHRIAALKRLRIQRGAGADAELSMLLRESVALDDALREDARLLDVRDAEVRKNVAEVFVAIDGRIKELKPRLYQGEVEMGSRREIAKNITELTELRKALVRAVRNLHAAPPAQPQWAHYEVKIDPLDGPKELDEKADFVEDMRDRASKKREELARLIRSTREEQAFQHQAEIFRTEANMFDESSVRDRVVKQTRLARNDADSASPPTLGVPHEPSVAPEQGAPQPPPPQVPGFNVDGRDKVDDGYTLGTVEPVRPPIAPNTSTPPAQSHETAAGAKQLDLNSLLNLRVDALDPTNAADLAALEALATDLDQLDGFLHSRADELRRRAVQLKEDEQKVLEQP